MSCGPVPMLGASRRLNGERLKSRVWRFGHGSSKDSGVIWCSGRAQPSGVPRTRLELKLLLPSRAPPLSCREIAFRPCRHRRSCQAYRRRPDAEVDQVQEVDRAI